MADLTEAIEAAQHETGTSTLARIAVQAAAPIIERQARAETAEEIARAIDAYAETLSPRDTRLFTAAFAVAAGIARGYTQPAETPGHRDGTPAAPAQPNIGEQRP